MKYVVTDDFVAAHGWTPDKTAKALMEPLARIGVLVERTRGFGLGGFQSPGLPLDVFRGKKAEVIRIVGQVLDGHPPAEPIERCRSARTGNAPSGVSHCPTLLTPQCLGLPNARSFHTKGIRLPINSGYEEHGWPFEN